MDRGLNPRATPSQTRGRSDEDMMIITDNLKRQMGSFGWSERVIREGQSKGLTSEQLREMDA